MNHSVLNAMANASVGHRHEEPGIRDLALVARDRRTLLRDKHNIDSVGQLDPPVCRTDCRRRRDHRDPSLAVGTCCLSHFARDRKNRFHRAA